MCSEGYGGNSLDLDKQICKKKKSINLERLKTMELKSERIQL